MREVEDHRFVVGTASGRPPLKMTTFMQSPLLGVKSTAPSDFDGGWTAA